MFSKDSIISTGRPGCSSVGASRTNFMMPWGQGHFRPTDLTDSAPCLYLAFDSQPGSIPRFHFVGLTDPGTSEYVEIPEALRYRIICYLLLSGVPDAGVRRGHRCIYEIWHFHAPPRPQLPSPPREKAFPAKFGGIYERACLPTRRGVRKWTCRSHLQGIALAARIPATPRRDHLGTNTGAFGHNTPSRRTNCCRKDAPHCSHYQPR